MGDAFPDPTRVRLMEALTARTGLPRVVFGSSGSDAVEIALKTARLATGRRRFVAFRRGYHGLSLGALGPLGYKRGDFAGPFAGLVAGDWELHPFGGALPDLTGVAAVLVEPIQGRGGVRVPPVGWLAALGAAARAAGALVIWDEIYTGFGRTGVWFRGEVEGTQPDLLCVGKALGGGFPISACLGSAAAMDAWGASRGEAIHTQTFLGNPVGCAMALATLDVLDGLVPTVAARGERLRRGAEALGLRVRGAGLLLGVEVPDPLRVSRALLGKGVLVLPSGDVGADPDEPVPGGMVLCLTPPFVVSDPQIDHFLHALAAVLA
jgi:acetylornithine/succinyldiaminopimelate/putrescine aminotransferase